jgi:hypothetical protein
MPIVRETDSDSSSVSSSSENVSTKGAKFEEECTYSKVSRNVSPTFGFDAKWSTRFLDRELHVKDLLHGAKITARVECMPTIQYVQRFVRRFRHYVKVSMMQPRN